jgi:hypothetical protein
MTPSIDNLFNLFAGVGVLLAGVGFAYSQYKTGSGKAKDDLIATLEKQYQIEKEKTKQLELEKTTLISSHQTQLNEMQLEIGRLKGLHEGNEKKLKEYTDILQGRSPEQTEFMKLMTSAARDNANYIKASSAVLKKINDRIDKLTVDVSSLKVKGVNAHAKQTTN